MEVGIDFKVTSFLKVITAPAPQEIMFSMWRFALLDKYLVDKSSALKNGLWTLNARYTNHEYHS